MVCIGCAVLLGRALRHRTRASGSLGAGGIWHPIVAETVEDTREKIKTWTRLWIQGCSAVKRHSIVVAEHPLQKQALRGRQSDGGRVGWLSRRHSAGLLQQANHSRRRCRFLLDAGY